MRKETEEKDKKNMMKINERKRNERGRKAEKIEE